MNAAGPLHMKRWIVVVLTAFAMQMTAAAADHVDSAISLGTGSGQINGSLMLPANGGKVPVVLIISGSGPTDRDGNSLGLPGKNDSLRMLALSLADAGFASVRYDKRGIGASAVPPVREQDLRFETYVQDAAGWIEQLAKDDRFSAIVVAGHSEGSLIGMLAANGRPVKAFVSIAGVAQGASAALRQQLLGKLPPDLAERNEAILSSLEQGQTVSEVPPLLASLYRPSVQPYLISWFKYVPTDELKKLRVPCLILQGDTDIQVPVSEAKKLEAAKPDAELQVIPGMNHVLKLVPADQAQQLASYSDPALPLAPELGKTLARFIAASMQEPAAKDQK